MDWSKAKNIIIAVLLAANILIGANYIGQNVREKQRVRQAADDAVAFLQQEGMTVEARIPQQAEKLPVLFLRLQRSEGELKETTYKGLSIIVEPGSTGFEIAGTGQQAAEIMPAAEALLKLYAQLSEQDSVKGKTVENIDLVYLLSLEEVSYAAQDTAVPAWRITVDGQVYYVNAYKD
jgi:regulatory protein YycI of two-component signal transduction system YycFG